MIDPVDTVASEPPKDALLKHLNKPGGLGPQRNRKTEIRIRGTVFPSFLDTGRKEGYSTRSFS